MNKTLVSHVNVKKCNKKALAFAIVVVTYMLSWFPVIYMTFLDVLEGEDLESAILKHVSALFIVSVC